MNYVKLADAVERGDYFQAEEVLSSQISGILYEEINYCEANNKTFLMSAAVYGCEDILKLLLLKGADPFLKSDENKTARDYALSNGHGSIARSLEKVMVLSSEE